MRGKNSGRTAVELLMVLCVLTLFGILAFMLISAGDSAYDKIVLRKNAADEARIASSYISVRLKQHDIAGGVRLKPCPIGGKTAIVLRDIMLGGESMYTWIYEYDGTLYECVCAEGEAPEVEFSTPIANITSFEAQARGNTVSYTVKTWDGSGETVLAGTAVLRSR